MISPCQSVLPTDRMSTIRSRQTCRDAEVPPTFGPADDEIANVSEFPPGGRSIASIHSTVDLRLGEAAPVRETACAGTPIEENRQIVITCITPTIGKVPPSPDESISQGAQPRSRGNGVEAVESRGWSSAVE